MRRTIPAAALSFAALVGLAAPALADDTTTTTPTRAEAAIQLTCHQVTVDDAKPAIHCDWDAFDADATDVRIEFDRDGTFFDAIRQDPILSGVKLIAEPWDVGDGGYQVGGFPYPFREWNDKYRDDVRRFWKGDGGLVSGLASRLTGSAPQFNHSDRGATSSVNLISAHDGFTLMDTVSYDGKHNEANGEENRDGHDENYSDNFGVEGPTDEPGILQGRSLRVRGLLATLLLAQGVPMLLAGDEFGNSQQGNNNAYAQDNELGWIDWSSQDHELTGFVRDLIELRRRFPPVNGTTRRHQAASQGQQHGTAPYLGVARKARRPADGDTD